VAARKRTKDCPWPSTVPVEVRWTDSIASNGWGAKAGAKMGCVSIGHLVERSKDRVVLAQSRSHYSEAEVLEIPASAIKSVRKLR